MGDAVLDAYILSARFLDFAIDGPEDQDMFGFIQCYCTDSAEVPSRASTPTPPLPKRPDRVQSLCLGSLSDRANWRISSATLLEISVLDDLDDNYKNNNEGRTGALRDVEAVAEYLRSDNDKEYRQRGGSPVSESKSSQQQNGPPSPHLLQGPEAAYQQQLTRHTRQEQMLKRSSQVIPVHHKHQNQRQLKHNNRVPSQSTIGPEHQHTKERPESKVLTEEEIAKLEMLFQKKKVLHERFDDIGASSSTDDLLSSTARYSGYGCGDGERALSAKKSWMDRPSGPIPLGFMVGLICAFTLVYNGVLSALVFQASRFPDGKPQTFKLQSCLCHRVRWTN
ncbi:hypothetical protein BC939DRAFT_478356 [Gamsiella multidivaricata]|uniref:uncharacterized protein n=1 Tax=Gamsiella multidivaricata TaxID=101098 RepID=UPI0022203C20|nr:uncharacterized protein BC939DRAFT_478356 [Gamsiella multidivaricata]KAI7821375.1 hypothetical protein BC939DRAFT_478356 [Gamsiella multidivaricata]